eukprot:TRINITY_DN2535_c0_g1_i2.p1 TRINITY_DN2535_c0_g1~~TRINITY_DN2535_c0_g1_i2.p1  ORF type:complete len:234 (+),score=67.19 TRINITY_DN2535_c0_g1_i2:212-913(+)
MRGGKHMHGEQVDLFSKPNSRGKRGGSLSDILDVNVVNNLKGLKAELRYQQTLANIAETYHSNRELLMGSDVVTYWARLHYSQRTLLDCYNGWRRVIRGATVVASAKTPLQRAVEKWRIVSKHIGLKIRITQATEDKLRESVSYAETKLAKALLRVAELEAELKDAANNQKLQYRVEDLERELRMARKEIERLKSEVDLLQSELSRVKGQVAKAEAKARQEEDRCHDAVNTGP